MPYTDIPHAPLQKPSTVAYLLAQAEGLAEAGAFKDHMSAYVRRSAPDSR